MITGQELKQELGHCIGTMNYYRMPFLAGFKYTDGVHLFMEKAEAVWLISDIAAYIADKKVLNKQDFLCIVLKVKDEKADLIFDDGNGNVLFEKKYDYTDCPEGEWRFFFIDTVLMLPSEY